MTCPICQGPLEYREETGAWHHSNGRFYCTGPPSGKERMTMQDEKYIVFKKDEFEKWFEWAADMTERLPDPVDDAVVIRMQDIFAAPALDAYAATIQTVIECAAYTAHDAPVIKRLQPIADYFHTQAAKSWSLDRRLPD